MYDGRDTIVMFDKLAYEDLLPLRFTPQAGPPEEVAAHQLADGNLRVLQACDALEEHGKLEKADDESPHSADIQRLDFKLNLLLDLAGQLLAASRPRIESTAVRFNAMGASWRTTTPLAIGTHGITEITLRELVVQPLKLPSQVVSGGAAGETRVRFVALGETVADHIEKLVFRRHRRQIADARRPRR